MTAQYEFRKMIAQVCIMGGVLVVICIFSRMLSGNHYMARVPLGNPDLGIGDIRYTIESDNKAELTDAEIHDGVLYLDLRAEEAGHCSVEVVDEKGRVIKCNEYTVGRGMTVFEEETGNFTGDSFVAGALSVFFLATAALMMRFYRRSVGVRLYSYNTIFSVGMFAFAGMTGMMFLVLFLQHIADPNQFPMRNVYVVVSKAGISFVRFTSPLVILFSVLLIISNIELLRHERYRFQNILGLLLGLLMIGGVIVLLLLYGRISQVGPNPRIREIAVNVCGIIFTYFECMLLGSVVCGIRAAKHVPDYNKDFIIILGCGFRKDGTLTPLLKGRVDKAMAFRKTQFLATGKRAVFIPSGGQGANETMPEAEAMYRYLRENGIPEDDIIKEDRSVNTYQNMMFSKQIIDRTGHRSNVMFSTTNYHVFRSGVWAADVGLVADGIGSGTKWWFWPNAFIRECVGLLQKKLKQEILLLVVLVVFFGLMSILFY